MSFESELLVSVRSWGEVESLLETGVSIIDLKEPNFGSLGPVSAGLVLQVAERLIDHPQIKLSIAMGELRDLDVELSSFPPFLAIDYAKVGLSKCGLLPKKDWQSRWMQWRDSLPISCQPVLVAFADHFSADAPQLDDVLEFALQMRCTMLIDTWLKNHQNLLDHLSLERLVATSEEMQKAGLQLALAGSLNDQSILKIQQRMKPNIFAVRGAACIQNSRTGSVDPLSVCRLQNLMGSRKKRRAKV